MLAKNQTTKFISTLLIIAILVPTFLFSKPKQAKGQGIPVGDTTVEVASGLTAGATATSAGANTLDTSISIKKVATDILKEIAKGVARRVLADLTKSTVNWINSGFWGTPLFLQNPQSFFKDIAKYEIKNLIDTIGYDSNRFPFGRQAALDIINSYKQKSANNFEYSLSRVINDPTLLRAYRNDFNVGGWNGFLINTQYPQNNYVGSQMLVYGELARKLDGTVQNKAQEVQKKLDQGMGFLSPQVCETNLNYNNGRNEFQQPKFDAEKEYPSNPPVQPDIREPEPSDPDYEGQWALWDKEMEKWRAEVERYTLRRQEEIATLIKPSWDQKNTCPPRPDGSSGFVTTTPGSVVAGTINKALGGTQDMALGGVNYGNSLSLIFDTLINKFVDKGLSALASKVNPPPVQDDWNYEGQTLGSSGGNNADWTSGPEKEIILSDFKKQISGKTIIKDANGAVIREEIGNTGNGEYMPGDIANTETELLLIDNSSSTKPGIIQILGQTWPKARELDICIPGPDINWEKRTDDEMIKNSLKLQEKSSDDDPNEAIRAQVAYQELKFAVDFFKDWIKNKMITELPSSIIFLDAVEEIHDLSQQSDQLIDRRRAKVQTVARLKAIQTAISDEERFSTQPVPGSTAERILISLKKQYNATRSTISNTVTIEDTQNELNIAKENLNRLSTLITQCGVERGGKGWTQVTANTRSGTSTYLDKGTEQNLFCDFPIKGGYNHESFTHTKDAAAGRGPGNVTHPEIPYVNANDVFKFDKAFGSGHTTIRMNCFFIYKAYPLDYKGNLPGITSVVEPPEDHPPGDDDPGDDPGDPEEGGGSHESQVDSAVNAVLSENPTLAATTNASPNIGEVALQLQQLIINKLTAQGLRAGPYGTQEAYLLVSNLTSTQAERFRIWDGYRENSELNFTQMRGVGFIEMVNW